MAHAEQTAGALDGGQRLQVVDTLLAVVEGAYAHLPAKRAAYAVDPVQALRLLRRRCAEMAEPEFHRALTGVVTGLRDGHTRYRGPQSLAGRVAVLPFLVEQYGPPGDERFVVSKVAEHPSVADEWFVAGVELTTWNGVPFGRAVDLHADHEIGGHPDARRVRALASMTLRSLEHGPPPDELRVDVGFVADGREHEVRFPWRVIAPGSAPEALQASSPAALRRAADPVGEESRRAKRRLYATAARRGAFHDAVVGRTVDTAHGRVGHLRLWSFDVEDDDAFLAEVERLLRRMPRSGVVVDLRGNPGGLVWAAERMLQLFTDATVTPARFSLLATPLTRAMAENPFNRFELEPWAASLEDALVTGEAYSRPLPLTDPEWCNDLTWRYPGPAVAVVDAATYSAGDLFAAGWADHGIGPLVCVGRASGGGGANVWTDVQLRDALTGTGSEFPRPPGGSGFTVAIRRAVRSGVSDGIPLEDLGVDGTPYSMTRRDLLEGNPDLLDFCAALLAPSEARHEGDDDGQ